MVREEEFREVENEEIISTDSEYFMVAISNVIGPSDTISSNINRLSLE